MEDNIRVTVIGSGSSGNAYLVEWGAEKFLLDAGMNGGAVRRMNGNRLSDIRACFVSHEHKDHAGFIQDILGYGIPVFMPKNDSATVSKQYENSVYWIRENVFQRLRGTNITFRTVYQKHDVPCVGYDFYNGDSGKVLHYVTDTREIRTWNNQSHESNFWICECDYTTKLMELNDATLSSAIAMRNMRTRETHLSDDYVCDFFTEKTKPSAVLFVHTSKLNFDEQAFRKKIGVAFKYEIAQAGKTYVLENIAAESNGAQQ